jgi:hypothetical protein
MGIDRMAMFIGDKYSIREVLAFPFMKDVVEDKPKTAAEVVDITPKPEEGIRKFIDEFDRMRTLSLDSTQMILA